MWIRAAWGRILHLLVKNGTPTEHMGSSEDGVVPQRKSRAQLSKNRKWMVGGKSNRCLLYTPPSSYPPKNIEMQMERHQLKWLYQKKDEVFFSLTISQKTQTISLPGQSSNIPLLTHPPPNLRTILCSSNTPWSLLPQASVVSVPSVYNVCPLEICVSVPLILFGFSLKCQS